jgi:AraC-like DNA-binding protein
MAASSYRPGHAEVPHGADAVMKHRVGGYREYGPPPSLAHCAEAVWIHETPHGPADDGATHRVLPDLGISLAFQGFRGADGTPTHWSPMIVGPKLQAQIFALVPGRELTAVRIKPEWIGPLLGIDPMAIEDRVEDLTSALPVLAGRLGDELSATRSAGEAAAVLVATLSRLRAACRTTPSPITSAALEIVRATAGTMTCERVAARLGFSERHLRRHVHDATGIPPKTYACAVRFVTAMMAADRLAKPAWADIALSAGYSDQSHFIRHSIAMTGASPSDLHAERRSERGANSMADLFNPA